MAQLDQTLSQDLSGLAGRAFAWWTGELKGLVPRRGARRQSVPGIVISLEDGRLWLVRDQRGLLGSGGESLSEAQLLERLARQGRSDRSMSVRLRLPWHTCLVRPVSVPERAAGDAARILALDLERGTPFSATDVYQAHVREPGPARNGLAIYSHLIVKRASVDAAIARLAGAGVHADAVDVASADGKGALAIDFLASREAGTLAAARRWRGTTATLAGVVALLAAGAVWQSFSQHEAALAAIEAETSAAKTRLKQAEAAERASAAGQVGAAAVHAAKMSRPAPAHLIEELTRLLPDDAHLTDLSLDGGTLSITGFAKSASALVPVLERSDSFAEAAVLSPFTYDAERGRERFSYRLRLKHAPEPAPGSSADAPAGDGAADAPPLEVVP